MQHLNQHLTKYELKQVIGQGGMATVYLAENKRDQTQVAVKLLNKEYVYNDNIRKRFMAEAWNMFNMSHPNIVKVMDFVEVGDIVLFVMEYVEGETLKNYLEKKGKLDDIEIKIFLTQILDAVQYVHEKGFIHRDIKPSNFMITAKGQIKLLDFGIAKNTDDVSIEQLQEYTQTGTSHLLGTPLYMSPEQIKSTKNVTAQSDLYSLGVVLWQMVMGRKPYDVATISTFELQTKIVNEKLPLTKTPWDAIIEKAVAKELEKRYASADEFKKALEKFNIDSTLYTKENQTITSDKNKIAPALKEKSHEIDSQTEIRQNKHSFEEKSNPEKKKDNVKPLIGLAFGCLIVLLVWQYTISKNDFIPMVYVEGGSFEMGCNVQEFLDCDYTEIPIRTVKLDNFYIGQYEVTQAEWKEIMGKNPSEFSDCATCPVENVSWNKIQDFIEKLHEKTGEKYRLPTEAEWEYAAQGGNKSNHYKYAGGNDLDEIAWHKGNSDKKTKPVGQKTPNELGVYDMSGNVYEWCSDKFGIYDYGEDENPQGNSSGSKHILRGGCWRTEGNSCRITCRNKDVPHGFSYLSGFRLVLDAPE